MANAKRTPKLEQIILEELARGGNKTEAVTAAGVTLPTLRNWRKDDKEFNAACETALEAYAESLQAEVRRRGRDGWMEPVFFRGQLALVPLMDSAGQIVYDDEKTDDDGNKMPVMVPAAIRKYSDRMLELEAKRQIPEYRDKHEVDHHVTGGVLVVPAKPATDEEWHAKHMKRGAELNDSTPDSTKH